MDPLQRSFALTTRALRMDSALLRPGPAPAADALNVVTTPDGARLAVQSFGEGPPLVFANGIGVRHTGLALQIQHLRRRFQVVTWDYRGIGESTLGAADVSMQTHAADLFTVMDALGLEEAVVVGWSMGCQVALEAIRLRPAAIRGLVLLSGTYGRPFHDSIVGPVARWLPLLWRGVQSQPWTASALLRLGRATPRLTLPLLAAVRFTAPSVSPPVFLAQLAGVAATDMRTYMRTMLELGDHDAWDVLATIACPALVIACTGDILTPASVARRIAAQIPGGECVVLEGLSHFGLIEDPDTVNGHIESLADRAYDDDELPRAVGGQ